MRNAVDNGNIELVKLMLKDPRVDPNAYEGYPLRRAIDYRNIELVELLLSDKRTDPSMRRNCALRFASKNGFTEIV